jgi:type I restriction enzyme S subunit
MNEFCLSNQKIFGENVVKTLGEVCKFDIGGTPSRSKNEYYKNGNNLWVSVRELNGGYIYDTKEKITDLGVQNSSVKLFAKDTILFSFKLSIGKTAIVGNPLYTNEAIAGILSKNNDLLNNKYLYYYLTINDFSKLGSGILGNGSLNKKSLEQIKIPIPSLERQKEIVEYCENNDTLIKQLEQEIENNKKQAQQFITGIVKAQVQTEEQSDTISVNTEPIDEHQNEIVSVEEEVIIEPKTKG